MKKNKAFSNQIAHIHKNVKEVVVDSTIKVKKITHKITYMRAD